MKSPLIYAANLQPVREEGRFKHPPEVPKARHFHVLRCPPQGMFNEITRYLSKSQLRQESGETLAQLAQRLNKEVARHRHMNGVRIEGCWRGTQIWKGESRREAVGAICFGVRDGDHISLVFGTWRDFTFVKV